MTVYGVLVAFSLCLVHALCASEKQLRGPKEQPSTSVTPTRIAWVGNSYTFNPNVEVPVPSVFESLSAEAGHSVEVTFDREQVTGGTTLFQHADPNQTAGNLTLDWFTETAGWDFVVLQDHSEVPGGGLRVDDISTENVSLWKTQSTTALANFFGPQLNKLGAKAVLYSSWGRRDSNNLDEFPDFETMTAKTAMGYMDYADILSGSMPSQPNIASVGRAMQWAKGQYKNIFDGLFQGDASQHPTQNGAYLIACVFFASIWNESPVGLAYAPPRVSDKQTIQSIAAHAVFDHGLPVTRARLTEQLTAGFLGRILPPLVPCRPC